MTKSHNKYQINEWIKKSIMVQFSPGYMITWQNALGWQPIMPRLKEHPSERLSGVPVHVK